MLARVVLGPEFDQSVTKAQLNGCTFRNGARNEWNEDRSPNHQGLGGKMGKKQWYKQDSITNGSGDAEQSP